MTFTDKFTTMEHLTEKVSPSYGAVLKYGNRVFVTDIHWKGGFTASIYEFVDDPEETGLGDIECRLSKIAEATQHFEDSGHAIAWCLKQK